MPTPTNLYEYYTGKGQALPSLDARSQTYQTAGLGTAADYIAKNKAGVADPNNQLLAYLTSASSATDPKSTYVNKVASGPGSPAWLASAQTPEQMAQTGLNGTPTNQNLPPMYAKDSAGFNTTQQVDAFGKPISGSTYTPTTTGGTSSTSSADKAFADYLTSLTGAASISPEQQALQQTLNTQTTDAQLANQRALNSGETMGFAGGEAQRVGRNNDITIAGTAAQLQARQAYDTSRSTTLTGVAKARYEYEQAKMAAANKDNAPFELSAGQSRYTYNPATGKYEVAASIPSNPSTQSAGFSLNPGESRYDANGKLIASLAPKPDKATQAETNRAQENDVATAVVDFQNKIQKNGWRGASPAAYNSYREQLINMYGASAALALDKAMLDAGIIVDYGT